MAATREVVVLTSSPPRFIPDSDIVVTPPSLRERVLTSPLSPELPSLPDLLKDKSNGLKSGSRVAEIPGGATLGFGSVASLLKDKQVVLGEEENYEPLEAVPEKKKARTMVVRKPRTAASPPGETTEKARPKNDGNTHDGYYRKASKPRKPGVNKVKQPEATGEEKSGAVDSDGAMVHDEAHRETTAMAALRKRRAMLKSQVGEPVSSHFSTLSTSDSAPTVEATVETMNKQESEKPKGPRGRPKKKEGGKALERKSLLATEAVVSTTGTTDEHEPVKPKRPTGNSKKDKGDKALEARPENIAKLKQKSMAFGEKKQPKKASKASAVTSAVSAHFSRNNSLDASEEQLPKSPKTKPSDGSLDLDHATERRRSWTPIRDSHPTVPESASKAPIEITDSPTNSTASSEQHQNQAKFASLLDGFGYQQDAVERAISETRDETGEAFTKRRKLQMILNPVPLAARTNKKLESEPEKEKVAGKKKPRTITELATAAYRAPSPQPIEPEPRVSTLLAARVPDPPSEEPKESEAAPPEKPKRAPRPKKPTKASVEKEKKATEKAMKQAKLAANKLLSPGAALLKYNNQEVLFGTSSQLVRDESPTFLRQVQQALKESELQGNSPESFRLKQVAEGADLALPRKKKGLWTEAARNLADEGFDVYDPGADEKPLIAGEDHQFSEDAANGEAHPHAQSQGPSSDFADIDEYDDLNKSWSETAKTTTSIEPRQTYPRSPIRPSNLDMRPSFPSASTPSVNFHLTSRSMGMPHINASPHRLNSIRPKSTLTTNRSHPSGPTASDSITTHETQNSVSLSLGTTRSSKAPAGLPQGLISIPGISLQAPGVVPATRQKRLVKCPQELPQGLIISSPKKVGHKRAKQNEDWPHIDEIEDSGEEITPSPPRRRKIPSGSPQLPLSQHVRGKDVPSVSVSTRAAPSKRVTSVPSDEQMAKVFPIITDAIKADPPSVQPGSLTWYEQILLYDPVVVEDLSEWLNKKGIRVQMEVAIKEKNRPKKRGKKAKINEPHEVEGFDESAALQWEKVELKEVPLQPWVVQRWCEEYSVCCIWKDSENKRKGWKARTG